ncbi:MAG: hypothetical protein KF745_10975 [Phycisphaeraceae bacterium]|nr:hypothetical protein [Phycisphaeraceae bacterium]
MTLVLPPSPFGLDLAAETFRALQIERRGSQYAIVAAAVVKRLDPGLAIPSDRDTARLVEVLERQGFVGTSTVISLPDPTLIATMFELDQQATVPSSSGAALGVISRVELGRAAGCGPQEVESASWPLPRPARSKASTPILALGCTHRDADALLNALECKGLEAVALEPRPLALARAMRTLAPSSKHIVANVDMDWSDTTIVLSYNGAIVYQRSTTEVGAPPILDLASRQLGFNGSLTRRALVRTGTSTDGQAAQPVDRSVDALVAEQGESLARELSMALSYVLHRYPEASVDLVLMSGDACGIRGLALALEQRLHTPIRIADPLGVLAGGDGYSGVCPSAPLATALGLALQSGFTS